MKIVSLLKHLLIPHKENDYLPHFFREHIMLSLLVATFFLLLVSFTSYTVVRTTNFGSSVVASVLTDLTNQVREKHNLPPLLVNKKIELAAKMKGDDMVNRQYFSHNEPDGTPPWHWLSDNGYKFLYAGENLALNFNSSHDVEKAWINSEKHKENILNKNYDDTGVAVIHGVAGTIPTLFVVQMFGKESSLGTGSTNNIAHWYEKFIFNIPYYVTKIYKIMVMVLIVALIMMIFIEIKKQHFRHILYGLLLGGVICVCIFINSQISSS